MTRYALATGAPVALSTKVAPGIFVDLVSDSPRGIALDGSGHLWIANRWVGRGRQWLPVNLY